MPTNIPTQIDSRLHGLTGTKAFRNDGGLRISPTITGPLLAGVGCLDIDGYGPRSLPTDVTPLPAGNDSSFADIEVLSVASTDLENGQTLAIQMGDESIVVTIANDTDIAALTVSKSTAAALAEGISDIVNAVSGGMIAELDPDNLSKVRITQRAGTGRVRIVVRRQDPDAIATIPPVSQKAISIQTGSTNPRIPGSIVALGEPTGFLSDAEASFNLRSNPSMVGPTNELIHVYTALTELGGRNIMISRLDMTWRPDESGNMWPVLTSTGTLPQEWLDAMNVDAETLDPSTDYVPSKKFRSLPWINARDLTTPQTHLDPTDADFRYCAIGKAMDIFQGQRPEYVHLAVPPGFVNAAKALTDPDVGVYPVRTADLPTSQEVLNRIRATDAATADNPNLQNVVYDTSDVTGKLPFKSFDGVGFASTLELKITGTETDAGGAVLNGAGFALSSGPVTRVYHYVSTPSGSTHLPMGDPTTLSGRMQLARGVANTINNDPQMTDRVRARAVSRQNEAVVEIVSRAAGYDSGAAVLPTRLSAFTVLGASAAGLNEINPDDTLTISDANSVIADVVLTAKSGASAAGEFEIGDGGAGFLTAAQVAGNIATAINGLCDSNILFAASEGARVYIYEVQPLTAVDVTDSDDGTSEYIAGEMGTADVFHLNVQVPGATATSQVGFFHVNRMPDFGGATLVGTHGDGDQISVTQAGVAYTVTCTGATGLVDGAFYRSGTAAVSAANATAALNYVGERFRAFVQGAAILIRSLTPGSGQAITAAISGGTPGTAHNSAVPALYGPLLTASGVAGFSSTAHSDTSYEGSLPDAVDRSFAHQLGAFCYSASIDFMDCRGVMGLEPKCSLDGRMTLQELMSAVGKERSHTPGRYVDDLPNDGTGILGFENMRYLDGTKRLRESPKFPVDFRMWGTRRVFTAPSWADVHLPTGNPSYGDTPLRDLRGELVDIGAYVSVIPNDVLYEGASARSYDAERGAFLWSGAASYIAAVTARDYKRSPLHIVIPNIRIVRDMTPGMKHVSNLLRFTTLETFAGAVRVQDAPTMAYNIDIFNRSDFVRQQTVDMVSLLVKESRLTVDPYIGTNMEALSIQALRSSLETKFNDLINAGYLSNVDYDLLISPEDRILSQGTLVLNPTVPGELRQMRVVTTLVPAT